VGILTFPGLAEYYSWSGNLATGEEHVLTGQFYSGSWSAPGWSDFLIRCQDCSVDPYVQTDHKIVEIECWTGFRIAALVNGTQVQGSGRIIETGQTFTTPLSGHVWIHVGADNHGKTYTIECTYQGITKQITDVAERSMPVIQFQFGAVAPPDIKIESIRMYDRDTQGVVKEYRVYPEGETPYATFAGERYYIVTVKNYGGNAEQVYFSCEGFVATIKPDPLAGGASWTATSAPIFTREQGSFGAFVAAGFCYQPHCSNPTEMDRKEFMIGYQPTETFPSPPDRWCETDLSLDEGSWCCGAGLALDTAIKVVGNASVRYDFGAGSKSFYWGMINGVINCNQYPWMLFYIKCSNPALIGSVYVVRLTDKNGKKAETEAVLHGTDFELKVLPVGETNQLYWFIQAGFDWSKVVKVEFVFSSSGAGSMWIDQLYFRIAPTIARKVFIKVVDKATGTPLPNITCRLGDYIDSVKFVYGGYMDNTDQNGNAIIGNIPVESGSPASFYIFAEDPQGKYVQLPEDDVVVHLETSDQSVTIQMTLPEEKKVNWLPLLLATGLIGVAFVLALEE
jgi:hypothetical protein